MKASREGTGKAGIKFWICNAEAGGKLASETLQKIHLTLNPETPTGDLEISKRGKK